MKVKSEREVAQSCPTPSDPVDCSPPGSSVGFEKLNHQGLNPRPWQWQCQVLTTELPGNFPFSFLLKLFLYSLKLHNVERENYKLERMIAAQWVVQIFKVEAASKSSQSQWHEPFILTFKIEV